MQILVQSFFLIFLEVMTSPLHSLNSRKPRRCTMNSLALNSRGGTGVSLSFRWMMNEALNIFQVNSKISPSILNKKSHFTCTFDH